MYKSKKPYLYGTGRRKSSVARVHLFPNGTGAITINGRDIDDYFGLETLKLLVRQPLATTDTLGKVDIVATVTGGGVTGALPSSPSANFSPDLLKCRPYGRHFTCAFRALRRYGRRLLLRVWADDSGSDIAGRRACGTEIGRFLPQSGHKLLSPPAGRRWPPG